MTRESDSEPAESLSEPFRPTLKELVEALPELNRIAEKHYIPQWPKADELLSGLFQSEALENLGYKKGEDY